MLEFPETYNLCDMSQDLVTQIINALIKDNKLNSAFQVYAEVYDVDWHTAYGAIIVISDYISGDKNE